MCLIESLSSISQNRARSAYRAVVGALNVFVAVWEVGLPPITQPNRAFADAVQACLAELG